VFAKVVPVPRGLRGEGAQDGANERNVGGKEVMHMHQLSSPRIDPDVLRKIEVDSLREQAHLASVPVPDERRWSRVLLWVGLLILVTLAVVAVVAMFL
jgi:hypothetical protein